MKILLLASYCEEENCTEELPCLDCIQICNVAEIPNNTKMDVKEGLDLLRGVQNDLIKERDARK